MNPSKNIGSLLQHLSFSLGRQTDQVLLEQLGIGYSQFKILEVLFGDKDVRQKHIADILGQTEASISRQIKLMQRDGFVTRVINRRNRREHLSTLTVKGEIVYEESLKILNNYHSPVYESLSSRQQRILHEALGKMHLEVCAGNKPGRCYPSFFERPIDE